MKKMSEHFFQSNRKRLGEKLKPSSAVVLFSGKAPKKSADEDYAFTTNRHFYYMCGVKEPDIMLLILKVQEEVKTTLFIKKPDPWQEKWVGKTISKEDALTVSGVDEVKFVEEFEGTLHYLLSREMVKHLYLDFEYSHFQAPLTKEQVFAGTCRERYPFIQVENVHPLISALRMIKAPYEVDRIKEAIRITDEGIKALMREARSGIREYALEAHFDFVLKCAGVKDYAFKTIAASGINGTVLHYSSNDSIIPEQSLILFDLGAQYEYYNADISRTFPVEGRFTSRQKTFYNIVLKANEEVIQAIKPGLPFMRLNEIVREIYFKELKALGLVETMEDVSKYYYHGVSHFLGLDTHDVGEREVVLEPGMVLTVEPGLYIEEEAIGIRIEDDVLVTPEGCEVLSKDIIKTAEEIEAYMQA